MTNEILKTEADYCNDLKLIVRLYLEPLRANEKLLKRKYRERIFCNLDALAEINGALLAALHAERDRQGARSESPALGGAFLDFFIKFNINDAYGEYCKNQVLANDTLQRCKGDPKFEQFSKWLTAKEVQHKSELRMQDLESFLIMPVQRLCKYPLLLRELLKATDEKSDDYGNLTAVIRKVEAVVTAVNESKREVDRDAKMASLREQVHGLEKQGELGELLLDATFVRVADAKALQSTGTVLRASEKIASPRNRDEEMYLLFKNALVRCTRDRSAAVTAARDGDTGMPRVFKVEWGSGSVA